LTGTLLFAEAHFEDTRAPRERNFTEAPTLAMKFGRFSAARKAGSTACLGRDPMYSNGRRMLLNC
jgi:hypothetical protein